MSIARGVNRKQPLAEQPRTLANTSKQLSKAENSLSAVQYEKVLTEMKHLMKENTKLKQQNLQLKQQIMLSKIEIENLKLVNQQMQHAMAEKLHLTQKHVGKNRSKSILDEPKEVTVKDFTKIDYQQTVSQLQEPPLRINWKAPKTSTKLNSTKYDSVDRGSSINHTKERSIFKPQSKQASIQSAKSASIKLTKKDEIMLKYQPFLNNSDSQHSCDVSELL